MSSKLLFLFINFFDQLPIYKTANFRLPLIKRKEEKKREKTVNLLSKH